MNIEELATKLMAFASQSNLSGAQLDEAKVTMRELKKLGLSNEDISQISKGRWSPSSVKGYCTGISAPSPSAWDNVVQILTDVLASGFSLEDVISALAVDKGLKNKKVSIEDVTELINAAASSGIELATLAAQGAELKEAGLSPKDLSPVVTMVKHLKENGLTPAFLPMLVKLAKTYGNMQKVLEAVSTYGSMQALEKKIEASEKNLKKIMTDKEVTSDLLEEREAKLKELAGPLATFEKAVKLGFGEKELVDLSNLCTVYGGPKAVFRAFKDYADLIEIKKQISKAKSDLSAWQLEINNTAAKYGHLTTAVDMCQKIISDQKLGLDFIPTLYSVAQKFGPPLNILKAIETYGGSLSIEKHADELAGTVAEREKLLAGLEAQFKEALVNLDGLYGVVMELANKSGRLEGEFKASENLQRLLNLINNPEEAAFGEHGQIVLMLVVSLQRWVRSHHSSFKWSTENIEAGLKRFIEELGGTLP